jgi:hypothetical protein
MIAVVVVKFRPSYMHVDISMWLASIIARQQSYIRAILLLRNGLSKPCMQDFLPSLYKMGFVSVRAQGLRTCHFQNKKTTFSLA